MSAADWLCECLRVFSQFTLALIGWLVIVPLVWLVPRRRDLIVVMGRDGGKFSDNTKYFYLQAQSCLPSNVQCIWVTCHSEEKKMLDSNGLPVVVYPSFGGVWLLARAGILVVDSIDWYLQARRFLLSGARKVQLWHGVGFKRIEGSKVRNEASKKSWISGRLIALSRFCLRYFNGRNVRYDLVNTTSKFYLQEVFHLAFSSRQFLVAGYPRNTFDCSRQSLLGADLNIIQNAKEWRRLGRRIVLVVPTFRESRPTPMRLDSDTCRALSAWCEKNQAELVFKFHPWERGVAALTGKHLHLYDGGADLYPLIGLAEAMVTDYSSIYMDFLLLDKPVLFFVPDLEEYVQLDRQIQFDYSDMTPGPKIKTWPELLEALEQQWANDNYRAQRQQLVLKAFDDLEQAEATPKILQLMLDKGWLKSSAQLS